MSHMGQRAASAPEIRILQVPDCPLVDQLQAMVEAACDELGIHPDISHKVGDHPSPSLLIGGLDLMTGQPTEGAARCRLDVPSRAAIVSALRHARIASTGAATPAADQPERG